MRQQAGKNVPCCCLPSPVSNLPGHVANEAAGLAEFRRACLKPRDSS